MVESVWGRGLHWINSKVPSNPNHSYQQGNPTRLTGIVAVFGKWQEQKTKPDTS